MPGARTAPRVTLREWLVHAERRFRRARLFFGHGTHSALDEAAWLLAHVLKIPHERLERSAGRALTAAESKKADALVARRIETRQPLAYLLKEAWLGKHCFYVDPRVIVPRSFIAELLRDGMQPWVARPGQVKNALDLCTGSGCLAVLLALEFPRAAVDAIDISTGALTVARRNIRDYRLVRRVRLLRSDLFFALEPARYDLIIANPPYVNARGMRALQREYSHEPHHSLAGGADGLHFVRAILRDASRFLHPDGILVVEIGHNRRALEQAFPRLPFVWLETSGGSELVFLLTAKDLAPGRPG